MSYGEHAILPLHWTDILGLRFGGYLVLSDLIDFATASALLSIHYPLTPARRKYVGPTKEPQIHMEWLKKSIP